MRHGSEQEQQRALLEEGMAAEFHEADTLCAAQDFSAASAIYSKAFDLIMTRSAMQRDGPATIWYESCDEAGLLSACRLLYKRAGCCLFRGRDDDSILDSKAALEAMDALFDRDGWGADPMGPYGAKAIYWWGHVLHALRHAAVACPAAAEEQVVGQAVATAPDGMPLVDVPLPLPGHLPPSSAGDDSSTDLWLCSAAELAEAAAGFSVRGRRPGVQLDRWHAIKGAEPVGLTSNGRRVQLAVLFGAPRQLHLQPLAPLLAAYMAQGWSKPPGGPLPEPPEDSSD